MLHQRPRTIKPEDDTPTSRPPNDIIPILNRNALGHVVDLINPYQPKRARTCCFSGNNDELGVLRSFLDVARHDRNLAVRG
jgi:hypothetical protein